MLKKPASFVLGSSKSQRTPEGTPPVSTRLWSCWTAFLSILLAAVLRFNFHVLPFTFLGIEVLNG